MIGKYIRERLSWILLLVFLQGLLLFIAAIDNSIPFKPVLYIVFLSTLCIVLFLIVRYPRETRFYKSLAAWDGSLDLSQISHPNGPLETLTMDMLSLQTELYKREASLHLVALEQEKDDLLSWIHEVKTPLTAMKLMIERLEDRELKSRLMYEWLRIHLLLDQQLHSKRMPFIQNDLFIEKVALEPVVTAEIKALQSWCIQRGIGFDLSLAEGEVLTDAKWLGFILRQLLTNAVKYSHDSDIVITSEMNGGHVTLRLQDSGRGIDPRDLPRIFEKGFTSTREHQDSAATGMGLYLTKKAADSLLISIVVDSIPGQGTAFTLTFPKNNEFAGISGM
ncbi:sensor histidine kinase [Paenibacillus sp. M1]|uniref:histidine kinase n=1 Tax=Paenibacillus haidiansis TaxID=1574488 RepID=A0ABU7VS78_9BACL